MKKIAILSASGSGKKRTIPALSKSEIAKVVAIHGRPSEKLQELSKVAGIATYSTLDEIEGLDFDILYVASPPFLHFEQLARFAKKGRPIICEKPLCISQDDTEKFRRIKNVPFMVAHHLRHQPAIKDIKEIISSNSLGEIRFAQMQWNFPLNTTAPSAKWKLDPSLGGDNPFYDAGIHVIDMSIHLFGMPTKLYASGQRDSERNRYESATCFAQHANFNVVMNASSVQTLVGNDLLIYFKNGHIRAEEAFSEQSIRKLYIFKSDRSEEIREYDPINLYGAEVENFCRYIDDANNEYVGTSIEEGLYGMDVLHAISKSLSTGEVIGISKK